MLKNKVLSFDFIRVAFQQAIGNIQDNPTWENQAVRKFKGCMDNWLPEGPIDLGSAHCYFYTSKRQIDIEAKLDFSMDLEVPASSGEDGAALPPDFYTNATYIQLARSIEKTAFQKEGSVYYETLNGEKVELNTFLFKAIFLGNMKMVELILEKRGKMRQARVDSKHDPVAFALSLLSRKDIQTNEDFNKEADRVIEILKMLTGFGYVTYDASVVSTFLGLLAQWGKNLEVSNFGLKRIAEQVFSAEFLSGDSYLGPVESHLTIRKEGAGTGAFVALLFYLVKYANYNPEYKPVIATLIKNLDKNALGLYFVEACRFRNDSVKYVLKSLLSMCIALKFENKMRFVFKMIQEKAPESVHSILRSALGEEYSNTYYIVLAALEAGNGVVVRELVDLRLDFHRAVMHNMLDFISKTNLAYIGSIIPHYPELIFLSLEAASIEMRIAILAKYSRTYSEYVLKFIDACYIGGQSHEPDELVQVLSLLYKLEEMDRCNALFRFMVENDIDVFHELMLLDDDALLCYLFDRFSSDILPLYSKFSQGKFNSSKDFIAFFFSRVMPYFNEEKHHQEIVDVVLDGCDDRVEFFRRADAGRYINLAKAILNEACAAVVLKETIEYGDVGFIEYLLDNYLCAQKIFSSLASDEALMKPLYQCFERDSRFISLLLRDASLLERFFSGPCLKKSALRLQALRTSLFLDVVKSLQEGTNDKLFSEPGMVSNICSRDVNISDYISRPCLEALLLKALVNKDTDDFLYLLHTIPKAERSELVANLMANSDARRACLALSASSFIAIFSALKKPNASMAQLLEGYSKDDIESLWGLYFNVALSNPDVAKKLFKAMIPYLRKKKCADFLAELIKKYGSVAPEQAAKLLEAGFSTFRFYKSKKEVNFLKACFPGYTDENFSGDSSQHALELAKSVTGVTYYYFKAEAQPRVIYAVSNDMDKLSQLQELLSPGEAASYRLSEETVKEKYCMAIVIRDRLYNKFVAPDKLFKEPSSPSAKKTPATRQAPLSRRRRKPAQGKRIAAVSKESKGQELPPKAKRPSRVYATMRPGGAAPESADSSASGSKTACKIRSGLSLSFFNVRNTTVQYDINALLSEARIEEIKNALASNASSDSSMDYIFVPANILLLIEICLVALNELGLPKEQRDVYRKMRDLLVHGVNLIDLNAEAVDALYRCMAEIKNVLSTGGVQSFRRFNTLLNTAVNVLCQKGQEGSVLLLSQLKTHLEMLAFIKVRSCAKTNKTTLSMPTFLEQFGGVSEVMAVKYHVMMISTLFVKLDNVDSSKVLKNALGKRVYDKISKLRAVRNKSLHEVAGSASENLLKRAEQEAVKAFLSTLKKPKMVQPERVQRSALH